MLKQQDCMGCLVLGGRAAGEAVPATILMLPESCTELVWMHFSVSSLGSSLR
jgi:hypothetical protein